MPVVFDASILIDLFNDRLKGERRAKLDHLVITLSRSKTKVLIPTPALTELMIRAGSARDAYERHLSKSNAFLVVPFDTRAAMECALLLAEAWAKPQQKRVAHAKFKFDWQIVAIASSRNATAIYSDDGDIARASEQVALRAISTDELPLPDDGRQSRLSFEEEPRSSPDDPNSDI
jgi:predicted nucleic acid-binding protein